MGGPFRCFQTRVRGVGKVKEGRAGVGRGKGAEAERRERRDMRAREGGKGLRVTHGTCGRGRGAGREWDTCGRERGMGKGQRGGANAGQRVRHARENAGANTGPGGKGMPDAYAQKGKTLSPIYWPPTIVLTEQHSG
jgi:hypothetical protein